MFSNVNKLRLRATTNKTWLFGEKKNCLHDSYWMVFQIKTLVQADNNTIF